MKNLLFLLIGVTISMSFFACAMGGKRVDYDDFPSRSNEYSAWMKCDNDNKNVCKKICTKYKRNNKCKPGHEKIVKLNLELALNQGFVLISKTYFIELLKK